MQLREDDFEDVMDSAADESGQHRARRVAAAVPNLGVRRASQHPASRALQGIGKTREAPGFRQLRPDAFDVGQRCAKAVGLWLHEIASITRLLASGRFSAT